MEVIEIPREKKRLSAQANQKVRPPTVKCTKKYVQPPRVQSFTPQRAYCPPELPIESKTTYCLSYIKDNQIGARPRPILPGNNIDLSKDEFATDTTTNMSYQPVLGVYKPKPIIPRQRLNMQKGSMECLTTIRRDYAPKYGQRTEKIVPCGNIRTSKSDMESKTTTFLSYMKPGPTKPVTSFKPQTSYCEPKEPMAQETTQKLSYLPVEVGKKENYPWAKKPTYEPPVESMPADTTYSKSYLQCIGKKEKPILPKDGGIFSDEAKVFENHTIYKESFLPCQNQPVTPYLPRGNITLPDDEMSSDTTNKLSFQRVIGEKRKPILPRQRKLLNATGSMQDTTTTRLAFSPKSASKPELIIPCGNIRTSRQPIEDKTTTALSYINPGPVEATHNYKPDLQYCKPDERFEADTVNKLSYQQWSIGPKPNMPWAQKPKYCRPSEKMALDSVTHMSFPAPGYFVEDCQTADEH